MYACLFLQATVDTQQHSPYIQLDLFSFSCIPSSSHFAFLAYLFSSYMPGEVSKMWSGKVFSDKLSEEN